MADQYSKDGDFLVRTSATDTRWTREQLEHEKELLQAKVIELNNRIAEVDALLAKADSLGVT